MVDIGRDLLDEHSEHESVDLDRVIAANKPMLLIGQRGAASEIVEQGRLGAVCAHENIDGISKELFRFYRRWQRSMPFEPNTRYTSRYHASNVAEQLAGLLDSVVRPGVDAN